MDWNVAQYPTQQAPDNQLELEHYMSAQAQGQPQHQHARPSHAASYPQPAQGQFRTFNPHISHGSSIPQQPHRTLSMQEGHSVGPISSSTHNSFRSPVAQGQNSMFQQSTPTQGMGYADPGQNSNRDPRRPNINLMTSNKPGDPYHDSGGGLTPPYTTSPMSTPMSFDSQSNMQMSGHSMSQTSYQTDMQQQPSTFQFQLPTMSMGAAEVSAGGTPIGSSHDLYQWRNEEDDETNVGMDVGLPDDIQGDDGKQSKQNRAGACERCKKLKVRCEMNKRAPEEPCKRCYNAGKDCWVPGRKKRRTPPKREVLLSQIRSQATEIERLLALLPDSKSSPSSAASAAQHSSPGTDLHSPLDLKPETDVATKPEVEEWIAKARESIEAFGGFIGAGGTTMGLLAEEDPEDSESSGDDPVGLAVEDEFGERIDIEHDGQNLSTANSPQDHKRSISRESEGSSPGSSVPRKKDSNASKLATVPGEAVPFGLIAKLSLKNHNRNDEYDAEEAKDIGVASTGFFRSSPSPGPERNRILADSRQVPYILKNEIITTREAEKLFKIYYDFMGLSISLLDPVLYTAQKTSVRSPFLFTVICAIASRFYEEKPELYPDLMRFAQLAAGNALISGMKNVEMVQAYILLSLYPVPSRRWEEDRCWLYLGLAIRVAADINLNLPHTAKPLNEQHAREMLNRTRTWLNCFNLDRSQGSLYGKPPMIPNTDYVGSRSGNWWQSSEYNMPNFDIQLCCYNADLRVLAEFRQKIYTDPKHPTGLNKDADIETIASHSDDELRSLGEEWMALIRERTEQNDEQNNFRTSLLRLAYSYARLVVLSFGFQHAFGKNKDHAAPFLSRCLLAAFDVTKTYVDDVGRPSHMKFLRHGPDAQSVFVTFACSFLVKLLQPKFNGYINRETRLRIRDSVQQVANLLGSPEVSIDERHTPNLYARFLNGLLATPLAAVDVTSPSGSSSSLPHKRSSRKVKAGLVLSPGSDRSVDPMATTGSALASPVTPDSTSPPALAHSFDLFGAVGIDPSATMLKQGGMPSPLIIHNSEGTLMNPSEWHPTPLPYDNELVQSMRAVQNDVWGQTISLPGFNWMNAPQSSTNDFYMQSSSLMSDDMFDPVYYQSNNR